MRRIAPSGRGGGGTLDMGADQVLPQAVIDHIGAILVGEGDRLFGALGPTSW
jgi:hypothetical protein